MLRFQPSPDPIEANIDGIYTAGIDDTRAQTGSRHEMWENRIQCYGVTAANTAALRDFVLAAIRHFEVDIIAGKVKYAPSPQN